MQKPSLCKSLRQLLGQKALRKQPHFMVTLGVRVSLQYIFDANLVTGIYLHNHTLR